MCTHVKVNNKYLEFASLFLPSKSTQNTFIPCCTIHSPHCSQYTNSSAWAQHCTFLLNTYLNCLGLTSPAISCFISVLIPWMVTANSTLWQVCDLCYGVDHLSVVGPGFSHDCQYQAGVVKPKKKKHLLVMQLTHAHLSSKLWSKRSHLAASTMESDGCCTESAVCGTVF